MLVYNVGLRLVGDEFIACKRVIDDLFLSLCFVLLQHDMSNVKKSFLSWDIGPVGIITDPSFFLFLSLLHKELGVFFWLHHLVISSDLEVILSLGLDFRHGRITGVCFGIFVLHFYGFVVRKSRNQQFITETTGDY